MYPTMNRHHSMSTSHRPSQWGLNPTMDSSLEVQISHSGFNASAYALASLTVRSFNGYGTAPTSADLLGAVSTNPTTRVKPPNVSFSRAYSATLSKFSSAKLGMSNKPSSRSISKALSTGGPKFHKRPKLPDFNPPHCERKVFDDGLVVQMIGSAVPPIIKMEDYLRRMMSFPSIEGNTPLLDIEFSLDETSFGFDRSTTASTLHIQVRSPSGELQQSGIQTPINTSLQTIYHSMDSVALSANRSNQAGTTTVSPFLSPFESNSLVNATPRPSPRLSASLMPQLSPIVLSELAALGSVEPDLSTDELTTPMTPAFSSVFTSDAESELLSLNITPLDSPVLPQIHSQMDGHLVSMDLGPNFDRGTEDAQTTLDSDVGNASFPSIASSNRNGNLDKESHWDSIYPSPSEIAAMGVLANQSIVPTGQQQSMSSSSVLAPLTQADFDATFEEVFRVGFSGNYDTQDEDQTTPRRGSSNQLKNRNLLAFMHGQGTSFKA